MRYYLGPFTQQAFGAMTCFAPPVGALGCIDLAPLLVQAQLADHRPIGVFWTSAASLPSEYALVGDGDCRELATTAAMQDAFRSLVGYRPQGARLADLVMDCLQGGSDPSGNSGPLPIVPDQSGWMDLWMPGHSKVLAERFEWGKPGSRGSNHTPKVKAMLRTQFAQLFADAQGGRLKDNQHHRRVLDAWCDKYNLQGADDWKEFVPANLQKDVPGRLKHETIYTDNFNRADAGTLGADWGQTAGQFTLTSNTCQISSAGSHPAEARYEHDLSSSDHYGQCDFVSGVINQDVCARWSSSVNTTFYLMQLPSVGAMQLFKRVSGTFTQIGSGSGPGAAGTAKCTCNGSTITASCTGAADVTASDTSIPGNLRCGLRGDPVATTDVYDNFQASDIAASGIRYTQLESTTRGMLRGMYARGSQ